MKDSYSVGELSSKLNINKETIRYYEKIGLLSEPSKDKSGYRVYTEKDIEIIKFIFIVKNLGFSLREISILLHDEILCGNLADIRDIVEKKINEIDERMAALAQSKRLLEKVRGIILTENIEMCSEANFFLK